MSPPSRRASRTSRTGLPHALRWGLVALMAAVPCAGPAGAQVSLVPAQHPVYTWLRAQETAGRVESYAHEALPLTRGRIAALLRQVEAHTAELTGTERVRLESFLRELTVEGLRASAEENYVSGAGGPLRRLWRLHRGDHEPRLYAGVGEDFAYGIDLWRTALGRRELWRGDDRARTGGNISDKGLRAFASFGDHFGAHLEAGNGSAGTNELLALDPLYGRTFAALVQDKRDALYAEASATATLGAVSADVGHGALRYGAGSGPALLVGPESSSSDWMRLRVELPRARLTVVQSSLVSRVDWGRLAFGPDTVRTKFAPERWLTLHRLTLLPTAAIDVSISHMVLYSDRGVDLGLLSPFAPLLAGDAEAEGDNRLWSVEAQVRPVAGLSVYGTLLLDDFGRAGSAKGREVGAHVVHGDWEAEGRWVRLDPFLYTHPDTLNAVQQRGFPLGHALGPNAQEAGVRLRRWLPLRSWVEVGWARVSKGLDPVDGAGVATPVGGGLVFGPGAGGVGFQEGAAVQEYDVLTVEGVAEILRGVQLGARFERRQISAGGRLGDQDRLDAWLRLESPLPVLLHYAVPFL